jgi:SAM-dependent methyltransferase
MNPYFSLLNWLHRPFVRRAGDDPYHARFPEFMRSVAALPAPVVVELGARNVSGLLRRGHFPNAAKYIGIDIHPGEGVDIVGDAHRLSELVQPASVDALFSFSVFEHLLYPWKVVLEINRVLKTGGLVFVATHPVWPAHESPWDFWRFPLGGLAGLFSRPIGFELIEATEGLPAKIYSLVEDPPTRALYRHGANLGVAVIARKIADYDRERLRWDIDIGEAISTQYPKPDPTT